MVTLQILVLSFLVRIQVAQQSGRFSIAFFVVCGGGERVVPTCVVRRVCATMQGVALPPTV